MKIPNKELHYSHLRAYGAGSIDLAPGEFETGCPRLYKSRYVGRRRPEPGVGALSYGSTIHAALALIEAESVPPDVALARVWDPGMGMDRWEEAERDIRRVIERGGMVMGLHTIAVEQDLATDLYEDPEYGLIRYGGRLDVVAIQDDDEDVPTLAVIDYKTDRGVPTRKFVEGWAQGIGYGMILYDHRAEFVPWADDVRIVGVYDAIKRYPMWIEYSRERIEMFRAWASAMASIILRDTTAEPVLNPGCSLCPIRDDCPAWQSLPGQGQGLLERLSKGSLEKKVAHLDEATTMQSRLDLWMKDVKQALIEHIRVAGPLQAGQFEWYLDQGELREADVHRLAQLMGDQFPNVAKVTLGEFDKWVEDHPEVDLSSVIRTVTTTRLKKRAIE